MGVPYLPNIEPIIAAGINPKTGLPIAFSGNGTSALKSGIRRQLGVMDEQDATRRYLNDGLPEGLNNELVERVLYYTGQAILFRRYGVGYILPYALDGNIDVYGRFRGVTPLPFRGGVSAGGKKGSKERITPWIPGLKLIPVYAGEEIPPNADPESLCVIIRDYIEPGSELITPRYLLMSPLLDCMSDIIPFARTALQNSTGIQGMRVNNEGESSNVIAANSTTRRAAINADRFVPIVGSMDFQDLASGNAGSVIDFMQMYTSLDNYRLSLHGIRNEGAFVKKAHMLEGEQEMSGGATGLVLEDGLIQRKNSWDLANQIFGWNVSVRINDDAMTDPDKSEEESEEPENEL
nr:MAG TPA: upper collar protein [Caudoviricetes sp.]